MLIENKGSGICLAQDLAAEPTHYPISRIQVPAGHNKVFRLQGVTGLIEAGRVWLPEAAPWLPDFENECMSFPAGVHDDQVDCMSQALEFFRVNAYHQNSDNVEIPRFGVR
jgi:predicted phage terminase large subunit-like protein